MHRVRVFPVYPHSTAVTKNHAAITQRDLNKPVISVEDRNVASGMVISGTEEMLIPKQHS